MKYLALLTFLAFFHCANKQQKPTPVPVIEKKDTLVTSIETLPETSSPPATPPPPDYDSTEWTEVIRLDPTILLDLRYATADNFVKEKMYDCPRCFLRPVVAKAVAAAHKELQQQGLGLKMYDCYRPRPIQWKLWNKVPDARYVADPRKGSMHNRGVAVDLTIVDGKGKELDMGTGYDFFGEEAYHDYTELPSAVLKNRKLLLEIMEKHGLYPTPTEWWHYSYRAKSFALADWVWGCE